MSAVQVGSHAMVTLSVAELEGLIRRIAREEMLHAFEVWGFHEEPTEYTPLFEKNLKRYHSLRRQIRSKTVVFLTIGPHDRAYALREELGNYGVSAER